jgi:hypothetical protein
MVTNTNREKVGFFFFFFFFLLARADGYIVVVVVVVVVVVGEKKSFLRLVFIIKIFKQLLLKIQVYKNNCEQ